VIGRPHIAKALVAAGVVGSIAEAFDKYLAPRRPLYSPKEGLDPARAAKLLHDAGGVAIMAHPGLGKWAAPDALRGRLAGLADVAAIDGVECYYSQHTAEQTHAYVEIASSLNLLVSGGSDFHGATKPHVPLGVVFQGRPLPAQVLADLRNGARHRKVVPAEL
jgi:predicted metal-dependent phosphoesterase TrpH